MKTTTQFKVSLLAAIVALGVAVPAFAEKGEQDIKLADCPAAVQQTINTNAAGGTVGEVEKETKKDGSIVYEAGVKKTDGSKIEVKVAADGNLIKVKAGEDEKDEKK